MPSTGLLHQSKAAAMAFTMEIRNAKPIVHTSPRVNRAGSLGDAVEAVAQ